MGRPSPPSGCLLSPRDHMAQWLGSQSSITKEMRDEIRDLNAYTSQTVFAGEWIPSLGGNMGGK